MKGLIHCHTENSRYDSAMDVGSLCKRAKELGYEAITLTDHGTLTGIDDFAAAAKEVGIKPIPGVEAYIQEDSTGYKRLHLLLIAIDDIGYQGIGKAVSESNTNIDDSGFPIMNKEILKKYFGEGSKYHGHVIATSACVGGVLAGIFLSPLEFTKSINKLKVKQEKYESPENKSYLTNIDAYERNENAIAELVELRKECETLSKKAYKKREKTVEKLRTTDPEAYEIEFNKLQEEMKESEMAKEQLEGIREKISLMKKRSTQINTRIKESKESQSKWEAIQNEIDEIESKIIPIEDLYDTVKDEAKKYEEIFGKGNFYIEIQHHGFLGDDGETDIEKLTMPKLIQIAKELNIPVVAANDAHTVDGSEKSVRARQIVCSLRFAKKGFISEVRKGDDQLYLKSEEELRNAISNVADKSVVDEAIANAYAICDRCNCKFEAGAHYPKFKGLIGNETSDDALRRMATAGIKKRFPDEKEWTETYQKRFEYELSVIAKMGYSDYFLIVQDFLEFGRKLGYLADEHLEYLKENVKSLTLKEMVDYVESNQSDIGFVVGAGRGSAAGSLIAYLVGITNIIDPLKYDLLFERFLNEDRVSMPGTSGI